MIPKAYLAFFVDSHNNNFAFFDDFDFSAGCLVKWFVAIVASNVRLGVRKSEGNSLAVGALDFQEIRVWSLDASFEFVSLFKKRFARFARGRLRDRSP